jgi:hypothetical protein
MTHCNCYQRERNERPLLTIKVKCQQSSRRETVHISFRVRLQSSQLHTNITDLTALFADCNCCRGVDLCDNTIPELRLALVLTASTRKVRRYVTALFRVMDTNLVLDFRLAPGVSTRLDS